jgi:hypothetical protein
MWRQGRATRTAAVADGAEGEGIGGGRGISMILFTVENTARVDVIFKKINRNLSLS